MTSKKKEMNLNFLFQSSWENQDEIELADSEKTSAEKDSQQMLIDKSKEEEEYIKRLLENHLYVWALLLFNHNK